MPFLLIRGKFLPKRGRPDGDSVRFTPTDPSLFTRLASEAGRALNTSTSSSGISVQLRYEGIDAMEKDAKPTLPMEALAKNKELLGFVEDEIEEPEGYIMASGVEKNGRPIVFVYPGEPDHADGESVFINAAILKKSVNYKLCKAGFVYPMYYMSLYAELRDELTAVIVQARTSGLGVWADDKSNSGFAFKTQDDVVTLPPIFPKLYRRLQKTTSIDPTTFLGDLDRERVAIMSEGRFVHFDDVVQILSGNRLKLKNLPEDLVFLDG